MRSALNFSTALFACIAAAGPAIADCFSVYEAMNDGNGRGTLRNGVTIDLTAGDLWGPPGSAGPIPYQ